MHRSSFANYEIITNHSLYKVSCNYIDYCNCLSWKQIHKSFPFLNDIAMQIVTYDCNHKNVVYRDQCEFNDNSEA